MSYFGPKQYVSFNGGIVAAQLPVPAILPFAKSSGPSYDPDAKLVIDQILVAGGSLSSGAKNGINSFVLTLKANSCWTNWIQLYGFAGGTNASHALEWRNPALTAISWVGTITSDLSGSHGDGSAYGILPYSPSYLPSAFGLVLRSATSGSDPGLNFGVDDGSNFLWLALNHNGGFDGISGSFSSRFTSPNTLAGQASMDIESSGDRTFYLNGSFLNSDSVTYDFSTLGNFYCFGRNDGGTPADLNSKNLNFLGISSPPLGTSNQAMLYTALNTLRAALLT